MRNRVGSEAALSGTSRLSEMSIDLGDEQVELERIDCMESLSTPFTITVDVFSPLEIDMQPHLGKPCGLKVSEDGELRRHFHGLVVSGEYIDESPTGHRYRLVLKPWSFFLAQNRSMAIFQDVTAQDIIKQVFQAAGISDFEFKLSVSPRPRSYCVQYQESDFAFAARLMEEEGWYYFFRHGADNHVMVICNAPSSHGTGTPPTLTYAPNSVSVFSADSVERASQGKFHLQSWHERVSTQAGSKVTMRDWDFRAPSRFVEAKFESEGQHERDDREVYVYPGRFYHESIDPGQVETHGAERSETMLASMRAQRRVFTGASQAAGLSCGFKVGVADHHVGRMNGDYLIVSAYHSIVAESYRSGQSARENAFNVRFEAIPGDTRFHPIHSTPRPMVQGLETAVVSGPAGEEIYTDKYGRVKVRFHWDRGPTPGESATCWVRVSQTGGLGNVILPRVGHEVLVDFLGGDPDRPVVVGRVFNADHMPVYPLPENKTRALWRTKRYGETGAYPNAQALDSGAPGANEIRFEDKGGAEELYIHAERDMNTRVRLAETHHVGQDQTIQIGHDRNETVVNDEGVTIGRNQTLTVVEQRHSKIGHDDILDVHQSFKLTANDSIVLQVGESKIEMTPSAISIQSPKVTVDGTASIAMNAPETSANGGGTLTLTGGLVKIN
ncbi:type VI secretion system Vgr family protein [Sphingomonas sp. S2-65]|uniref:type VI secretion system Vgr family protein n=1 Tax=Sphingomonas sp. S2-65 TaxID=2903960 RepID=UPI001F3E03DA|nr:type VI secretion system tip protein TssI/VgrG [Sphingomonas sp. S2-65]UYY57212.1 type VI secretion system tip protein TssI/VgrG [Sphingomonas sp. S2-65]